MPRGQPASRAGLCGQRREGPAASRTFAHCRQGGGRAEPAAGCVRGSGIAGSSPDRGRRRRLSAPLRQAADSLSRGLSWRPALCAGQTPGHPCVRRSSHSTASLAWALRAAPAWLSPAGGGTRTRPGRRRQHCPSAPGDLRRGNGQPGAASIRVSVPVCPGGGRGRWQVPTWAPWGGAWPEVPEGRSGSAPAPRSRRS